VFERNIFAQVFIPDKTGDKYIGFNSAKKEIIEKLKPCKIDRRTLTRSNQKKLFK